jgi:Fe-S-cluster containining protein
MTKKKLGRNAPCPCGSGKKFKKCCGKLPTATRAITESPIAVNQRIAYEGRVGRERKQWSEDFLAWKTKELEIISVGQKSAESASGRSISCVKGCSFCCSQYVGASLQECDGIVYWLYQHPDRLDTFVAQYGIWRKSLREHERVFKETSKAASISMANPLDSKAREIFTEKAEAYHQLNISCPFLVEDACSIYPVRPFACASHVVVSSPEHCKPSSSDTVESHITRADLC